MGGREVSVILDGAPVEADEADLAQLLASDAMALPAFVPNGGPFPGRPGRIVGTLPATSGARAALASLYGALMTDRCLDALGMQQGPLLVEGSFAGNRLYCGALASLRPAQPVLPQSGGGTAYGASLLATWPRRPQRPVPRPSTPLLSDEVLAHRARWRAALGL
jgi:sugar (pentulose or hexulose) kinase